MAYITETKYSKDEILENYINDIYLGQRGQEGIYGIWEASEYYFSKEPRDPEHRRDGEYRGNDQLAQPPQSVAASRPCEDSPRRGPRLDDAVRLHQPGCL